VVDELVLRGIGVRKPLRDLRFGIMSAAFFSNLKMQSPDGLCQRVVIRVGPLGVFVDVGLARRVGSDHAGEQGSGLSPKR
jgi:hypothetical protein